VDPVGSGQGPVAGSCKYSDEPSGSGATELVQLSLVHNSKHAKTILLSFSTYAIHVLHRRLLQQDLLSQCHHELKTATYNDLSCSQLAL
jgi:hypothetical protein